MVAFFHHFKRLPLFIWRGLNLLRALLANLLLLLLILLLIGGWLLRQPAPEPAATTGALLLRPVGTISEAPPLRDSWRRLLREKFDDLREIPLQDILDAIDRAKIDPAIPLLVIDPGEIEGLSLSQALTINRALTRFRKSGKKIIAVADHYDQNQYLLASAANEMILNPIGGLELKGLALYRLYSRRALEKLQIDFHLFRAGTYKSALEPLIRDDMSPAARKANQALLDDLWQSATAVLRQCRPALTPARLEEFLTRYEELLTRSGGQAALAAQTAGLVDRLMSRPQWRRYLAEQAGKDPDEPGSYRKVAWEDYLERGRRSYMKPPTSARIALITARGEIVTGNQPDYRIGAENLAEQLRRAARDEHVEALVLRIDSGGGSLTASEIIRQELLQFKATGKPVVISMGPLAASGAYWIAAVADEIWAETTTLTGSIGVFGAWPTLDRSLDQLGLHSDGVATNPRAGALALSRPLDPSAARILQLGVNNGYHRFLEIVAAGRKLDPRQVAKLAEGRVWSGRQARELGLVDHLGDLAQAVGAAAARVGLTPKDAVYWTDEESEERFWRSLLARGRSSLLKRLFAGIRPIFPACLGELPATAAGLPGGLFIGGDPAHLYAWNPLGDFTRRPSTKQPLQ